MRSLLALLLLVGCHAAPSTAPLASAPAPRSPQEMGFGVEPEIEAALIELYRAFCFDPGQEPDWDAQRALFAPGARFVSPFRWGQEPELLDEEAFLERFRQWVTTGEDAQPGLHERIVRLRIERIGVLAHAWVTFEGFVPSTAGNPEPAARDVKLGVDSLVLLDTPTGWKVASFATQYELPTIPLPQRFRP